MIGSYASVPADALALLRQSGADRMPHSGRTLLDHLVQTYFLLKEWGCGTETAMAGLFHSIYGTNVFISACVDPRRRDIVREVIGNRAEEIVHLFSTCHRPRALLGLAESRVLENRFTGELQSVDDDMAGALVKIECANLIEQRAGARFLRAVRSLRGFRSGVLFPSEMMGAIEQAIADSAAELAKN